MKNNLVTFDRNLSRRVVNCVKAWERSVQPKPKPMPLASQPIQFFNDSGETIPAMSLMQVSGTVQVDDGPFFFKVKKPIIDASCQCPLLISGLQEVEDQKIGTAQPGPVYRVQSDGGTYDLGDRLGPVDSYWTATFGGMYSVLGPDSIAEDVYRVMFDVSSFLGKTSGAMVAGTPSNVLAYDSAGTLTSKQYLAVTRGTTIPTNTDVILWPQYGRLFALKYC